MRGNTVVAVAMAATWACGGATFNSISGDGGSDGDSSSSSGSSGGSSGSGGGSGGGSSSGSSSGGSGSSSGGGTACPVGLPPYEGSACPDIGMECEYGILANPVCTEIFVCTSSGWSTMAPPTCPTGTCPATYADISQGQDCTPQGISCAYAEGQCNCSSLSLSVNRSAVWQCSIPAPGCPRAASLSRHVDRSQSGLSCDYGACSGGIAEQCTDGQVGPGDGGVSRDGRSGEALTSRNLLTG